MKKALIIFASILLALPCWAVTNVSGGVYSNTTWTKANSPYIVSGNLVVFDGAILTIEPGVQVLFDSLASIELRGSLFAVGTATDTISFTGTKEKENWWRGIKAVTIPGVSHKAQMTVDHCYFAYSYILFDLYNAVWGPYTFKNTTFYKNNKINEDAPRVDMIVEHCLILDNNYGFYGGGEDGKMSISNSWFVGNKEGMNGGIVNRCVFINNVEGAYMYQSITNCYFFNNKVGIRADHHHDTKIQYNEIHDNEIGVIIERMGQDAGIIFKDNKVCNNTIWNVQYNYTSNIDLSYNCWCNNDSAVIRSKIRDGYVDTKYGLVSFSNWQNCSLTDPPPLVIPEQYLNNVSLSAYPNPATNTIIIESNSTDIHPIIVVIDVMGRNIYQSVITANKHTIDVSQWPAGIYLVKYLDGNNTNTLKVIKL